jgi:hypothetical protein
MHWLSDDSGAAAVIVTLSAVALFGMAAFALDTAAIYEERRELQNGADAGALAIAEDCLRMPGSCSYGAANSTANTYADANADDGAALLDGMTLDAVGNSVTVELRTEEISGSTVLAPIFGQVLGFNGASVAAEASAVWGYAGRMRTLPLVISDCEWEDVNRPALQDGPPFLTEPWLFVFHQGNQGRTCEHSNSGFDLPGGFGWLLADDGTGCEATFTAGAWKPGIDPGSSPPATCTPETVADMLLNGPSFLPYYEEVVGEGDGGSYKISALGAFWVTGYNFGGQFKQPANDPPCDGSSRCLAGYFINATTSGGDPGGSDRGASIVKLIP